MGTAERLDLTFLALADPTRRAILARLATGEASVSELAEPFDISQPAISRHLKVLERAGLISVGQDAQRRPRRLEGKPMREAEAWIDESHELAKKYAYTPEVLAKVAAREGHSHLGPFNLGESYRADAEKVSERRAVIAAWRLAALVEKLLE